MKENLTESQAEDKGLQAAPRETFKQVLLEARRRPLQTDQKHSPGAEGQGRLGSINLALLTPDGHACGGSWALGACKDEGSLTWPGLVQDSRNLELGTHWVQSIPPPGIDAADKPKSRDRSLPRTFVKLHFKAAARGHSYVSNAAFKNS